MAQHLPQGLHHHMQVAAQKYGLCLSVYDLGCKSLYCVYDLG